MANTAHTARRLCLAVAILTLVAMPQVSKAQICENFSDGELHNNPSWTGDISNFRINSNSQLQLYADEAGASQLSFPYRFPVADTVEWHFWLRIGFTPTVNNYAVVALVSDSADLSAATHSLSLTVTDPSNSQKNICLFQDDTPLFTYPYQPRKSNNRLRFRIRMVDRQQLLMDIDTTGDVDSISFIACGSATTAHSDMPDCAYFGIQCQYTSSRAHLFFLDDIGINCSNAQPTDIKTVNPGDILVNEVLFNPKPGGADYVELYNNSDRQISLSQLRLAATDGDAVTNLYPIATEGVIEPQSLIAVTTNVDDIRSRYTVPNPNRLLQVDAMPPYSDKSGTVAVATIDSILIDHLDYNEKMHSSLLSDIEGVALERRSPQRPTQEPSNWYSAASTVGYGTPTGPNSQQHEILFDDNDFKTSPTLFSPDGDGYNDLLDISYNLLQCGLTANISIYNRQGITVRHLAKAMLLGCQGDFVWDGTDDNGQPCRRGTYLIVVEAYNENGARQSWRRTIILVRR